MRADIRETAKGTGIVGSRRSRAAGVAVESSEANVDLHLHAVDAAFADESMPMMKDRGSRRDASHATIDAHDDLLLKSLSEQLELLHEQQREIRLLLDQAGRRRVDRVAN